MNILFVTNELGYRGTPRFLLNCARIAHQNSLNTLVWGLDEGGFVADRCLQMGIPVLIGDSGLPHATGFKPDIVHIHRGGGPCKRETELLRTLKAATRCKIMETNVFGILDLTPNLPIDLHSHISYWDLWRWRRWLWPFHKSGIALPYCIDTTLFTPTPSPFRKDRGIPDGAFLVGRLGKTDWQSLGNALNAAMAKNNNIWFATVGDYSADAGKHPIFQKFADRIITIPRLNGSDELSRFYSACDVTINFSPIGESFGYVVAESMSCGTPVIVLSKPCNDNAQIELAAPEYGGFPVDGSESATDVILELADHPETLATASTKCRASIEQRYSTHIFAPKLLKVYDILLKSKSHGRQLEKEFEAHGFEASFPEPEIFKQLSSVRGGLPSKLELLKMKLAYSLPNALRIHFLWRKKFSQDIPATWSEL